MPKSRRSMDILGLRSGNPDSYVWQEPAMQSRIRLWQIHERRLLDHVFLDRLDLHADFRKPPNGRLDLTLAAIDLEGDQTELRRDVGAADVGDYVKLLPELIDHRLLQELRRVGEVDLLSHTTAGAARLRMHRSH